MVRQGRRRRETTVFPVIEIDGRIVACAIGTLETGVPNPQSPRGRAARLSNVVTLPEHQGQGFGTALVDVVIEWARSIDADRVDLSATPQGQRIYGSARLPADDSPADGQLPTEGHLTRAGRQGDLHATHAALADVLEGAVVASGRGPDTAICNG